MGGDAAGGLWKPFSDDDERLILKAVESGANTVSLDGGRVVDLVHRVMMKSGSTPEQFFAVSDKVNSAFIEKAHTSSTAAKTKNAALQPSKKKARVDDSVMRLSLLVL